MPRQLVECVPNFSEGRDPAKIDAIVKAILSVPEVALLDRESDADHNRRREGGGLAPPAGNHRIKRPRIAMVLAAWSLAAWSLGLSRLVASGVSRN